MRHLRAYTWDKILEEKVPLTIISLKLIQREKETEKKEYDRLNRKIPRRRR